MLTTRYIASLKGIPGTTPRSFKVHDVSSPAREIAHEIVVDTEGDVGQVEISYANDITLTAREEKVLRIMEALIQYRMFEELREKEAATYGIGVQASYNKIPTPGVTLNLRFETERTKVDLLKEKTYAILQEVTDGTFSNEDFKRVVLPSLWTNVLEQKMNRECKGEPYDLDSTSTYTWRQAKFPPLMPRMCRQPCTKKSNRQKSQPWHARLSAEQRRET